MKFLETIPSFSFLLIILAPLMLSGHIASANVTFHVHNKCPFPIWPATAANTGHPTIADGGFYLPSGNLQRIVAPPAWSGRIWARTRCNFPTSTSHPACETGDCGGRLACNGLIGTPPVTLLEITTLTDKTKPNFYDVSLVDGYNLPISVTPKSSIPPKCTTIGGCSKNLNDVCPPELRVVNKDGEIVACKSACLAFDMDSFCCRNEFGTPDKCKPNVYSKMFKDGCPSYYSYAYDMPSPLVSCGGKEYVVTFCPSSWGGDMHTLE